MRTGDAVAFLDAHGAAGIPHPGGTLLDHLVRVAEVLSGWGNPDAVVLAGLCHATYGTDGFAIELLPPDSREPLRAVVGDEAERLVHLYGSCARRATYRTLDGPGPTSLTDRWTGQEHALDRAEARAFVEITVANELDVLAHNDDLAGRHGPAILEQFRGWRRSMSPAAWTVVDAWPAGPA